MPLFPKADTRVRRRLRKQREVRVLEDRRDRMLDQGFLSRAKAVEGQISLLKRQIKEIEES